MADTRGSLWIRWPNADEGPLWVGLHLNQRAGSSCLVGLEVWTEPPGDARQSLGPAAAMSEEMLPWTPQPLRTRHIDLLRLGAIHRRLVKALVAAGDDPAVAEVVAALTPSPGGRPATYPPEHFARVAGVYLRALREGSRAPTQAVARTWEVSTGAAAKWVMRARDLGHLPPAGGQGRTPTADIAWAETEPQGLST